MKSDWEHFKKKYAPGDKVEGVIIQKRPFGVFIDIGEKFLVLLEIIVMKDLDYELYKADKQFIVGETVKGYVANLREEDLQMRITQEPMLK